MGNWGYTPYKLRRSYHKTWSKHVVLTGASIDRMKVDSETTLFEEAMELGSHQCQRRFGHTVDGSEIRRLPVEVGSFSHYLQGFSTIPGGCLRFLNHQQYHVYTKYCKNKFLCLFESLQKSMSSFQFFSKNFAYLHDMYSSKLWLPKKSSQSKKKLRLKKKIVANLRSRNFGYPNWSLISIKNSTTNNVWGFQQHSHHSESSQEASIGQTLDRQVNQMKVKALS